jgi:hypothetical protein
MPSLNEHIRRTERQAHQPPADIDAQIAEFEARGGKITVIDNGVKTMDMVNLKHGSYQSKLAGALRRELE